MDDIKLPSDTSDGSKETSKIPPSTPSMSPSTSFASSMPPHSPNSDRSYKFLRWHVTRNQFIGLIAGIVAGLLIVTVGGFFLYKHGHKKAAPKPAAATKSVVQPPAPAPTTVPSRLTGLMVPTELSQRPVTGVMIENSPDARPQSGLQDAGVVYEAIAEGGITRFLALFEEGEPDYIGPVRSARPYYLEWLLPFDAPLAHAGGSPDALNAIRAEGVKDLDQFANSGAYQRVSSRFAPHNLYTSTAQLDALEKSKGYTSSNFTGFPRKPEQPAKTPLFTKVDFALSGFYYNVHYDYDQATNSYNRSEGGKPHVNERTGKQLNPKVVIAIVLPYSIAGDGIHSIYNTNGTGKAYVFQDGIDTEGTWTKNGTKSQIEFKDAKGNPLKLNPGQTWITAVGSYTNVSAGH